MAEAVITFPSGALRADDGFRDSMSPRPRRKQPRPYAIAGDPPEPHDCVQG
jgi:hypothetical protein